MDVSSVHSSSSKTDCADVNVSFTSEALPVNIIETKLTNTVVGVENINTILTDSPHIDITMQSEQLCTGAEHQFDRSFSPSSDTQDDQPDTSLDEDLDPLGMLEATANVAAARRCCKRTVDYNTEPIGSKTVIFREVPPKHRGLKHVSTSNKYLKCYVPYCDNISESLASLASSEEHLTRTPVMRRKPRLTSTQSMPDSSVQIRVNAPVQITLRTLSCPHSNTNTEDDIRNGDNNDRTAVFPGTPDIRSGEQNVNVPVLTNSSLDDGPTVQNVEHCADVSGDHLRDTSHTTDNKAIGSFPLEPMPSTFCESSIVSSIVGQAVHDTGQALHSQAASIIQYVPYSDSNLGCCSSEFQLTNLNHGEIAITDTSKLESISSSNILHKNSEKTEIGYVQYTSRSIFDELCQSSQVNNPQFGAPVEMSVEENCEIVCSPNVVSIIPDKPNETDISDIVESPELASSTDAKCTLTEDSVRAHVADMDVPGKFPTNYVPYMPTQEYRNKYQCDSGFSNLETSSGEDILTLPGDENVGLLVSTNIKSENINELKSKFTNRLSVIHEVSSTESSPVCYVPFRESDVNFNQQVSKESAFAIAESNFLKEKQFDVESRVNYVPCVLIHSNVPFIDGNINTHVDNSKVCLVDDNPSADSLENTFKSKSTAHCKTDNFYGTQDLEPNLRTFIKSDQSSSDLYVDNKNVNDETSFVLSECQNVANIKEQNVDFDENDAVAGPDISSVLPEKIICVLDNREDLVTSTDMCSEFSNFITAFSNEEMKIGEPTAADEVCLVSYEGIPENYVPFSNEEITISKTTAIDEVPFYSCDTIPENYVPFAEEDLDKLVSVEQRFDQEQLLTEKRIMYRLSTTEPPSVSGMQNEPDLPSKVDYLAFAQSDCKNIYTTETIQASNRQSLPNVVVPSDFTAKSTLTTVEDPVEKFVSNMSLTCRANHFRLV